MEREICNHRMLNHPNIVGFKEVRGAWVAPGCMPSTPLYSTLSAEGNLLALWRVQVFLTPSHLGIVMEYAAGGELFERIVRAGRFSEDEARYFFQQLISGVDYCHASVRYVVCCTLVCCATDCCPS